MPARWPWSRPGNVGQANSGGINIANAGTINTITIGEASYLIEDFPMRPPAIAAQAMVPSQLLAARYQVVGFTGRQRELSELARWRDNPAVRLGVQLVHAPGGQGKTRLAAAFAIESSKLGWQVLQARHDSSAGDSPARTAPRSATVGERPQLVVVDYAERWPTSHLLRLIQDPILRGQESVRVLLLARPAGLWWESLRHDLRKLDAQAEQLMLPPLTDRPDDRLRVFEEARDRFASHLNVPDADSVAAPDNLAEPAYGLVLTIHMAALVAVDAHRRGHVPPADPAGLSAYLLDREQALWRSAHDQKRISTEPQMMARTVCLAILTRGLHRDDAVGALTQAGLASTAETSIASRILDDHRLCYPPADNRTYLEPLYPDRLGEDFLALQTPGHNTEGYEPDGWAAELLPRLLSLRDDRETSSYTAAALTVLVETTRRWPHIGRDYLYPLLRQYPDMAIAAGGATLFAIANLPDVDRGVVVAIDQRMPYQRHVDLDVGMAAITALTSTYLEDLDDEYLRACVRGVLALRLFGAGQYLQAMEAGEECVKIFRRLVAVNPSEYELELAVALNNLGTYLSNLQRAADALAVGLESVEIRRRYAAADLTTHGQSLAAALLNLGPRLSDVGQTEEALVATGEAVEVYRSLAAIDPAEHEPHFAMALINLGVELSNLGRRDEALEPAERAVEIYRRLAFIDPMAHEPEFALALSNLGGYQSTLGHHEEAVAAAEQAVQIYRRLAAANPKTYEVKLAVGLLKFGDCLSGASRYEEAISVTEQAVGLCREAVAGDPSHGSQLVTALINLGARLAAANRWEGAAKATNDAIGIYRQLPDQATMSLDIRVALTNLVEPLLALGRFSEVLAATAEAVELSRLPTAADPERQQEAALAHHLRVFAGVRVAVRRDLPEALVAANESLSICHGLARSAPKTFADDLALTIQIRARVVALLGRRAPRS